MNLTLGPLTNAEVVQTRNDSKQREIETLRRQIRAKESQIGQLADEIRWHKLRLEDLGAPLND